MFHAPPRQEKADMFVIYDNPKTKLCTVHEERPKSRGMAYTYCGRSVGLKNRVTRKPNSKPYCSKCAAAKKKTMDKKKKTISKKSED
jgi:hypothetical protein